MSRKIPKKNSKTKKKPINNSRRYKLYNEIRKITKKHPKIKQKINGSVIDFPKNPCFFNNPSKRTCG